MSRKHTYEEVKQYIEDNEDILLSDLYINSHKSLSIRCKCGNEYRKSFTKYKHGDRCICQKPKIEYTYSGVKEYVESQGYELLSDKYISQYDKLEFKCDKGHIYSAVFKHFKEGSRCPVCYSTKHNISLDYIKEYLREFNYEYVDGFVDTQTPMLIRCPEGHIYKMEFQRFKYLNQRCPKCQGTNGEKELMRIFDKNNIGYYYQHKFEDCKNILPLPFDFFIYDKNTIVEYDGVIHFEPVKLFGGEKFFKQVKDNDKIKNDYCLNNQINLIRIPYWNFNNMEEILIEKQII